VDNCKKNNLKILFAQAMRFLKIIFLPLFLIILTIYLFNFYLTIPLFKISAEVQFKADYIIVVIGLLIVGGIFAIILIHLIIGILYSIRLYKLTTDFSSKIQLQDLCLVIFIMILVEILFWQYYHSITYLFSNLISTLLFTIYIIICWKDNIVRNTKNTDQKNNLVRLSFISKKNFHLFLIILLGLLIYEVYITWIDTLNYFSITL
jgi:hypothetical protein